jgi:two-component system response regulator FixJ
LSDKSDLVLIVDDDASVRSALKFALEQEGLRVRLYADAAALLADTSLPDRACLVVDYVMPKVSGLEMLAALRARGNHTPAILISPSIDGNMRRRGLKFGVSHFLEKPLLGGTFLEAIRSVLSASRSVPGMGQSSTRSH